MLFRDYVILLYQSFLQDKNYLQTLRDKIKSDEFNKDQMYDPAFEDWKSIDPSNLETHHGNRIRFHQINIYDPQQGVYTYEDQQDAREKLRIIRECLQRGRERRANTNSKPKD
jgi:hypothetical protein